MREITKTKRSRMEKKKVVSYKKQLRQKIQKQVKLQLLDIVAKVNKYIESALLSIIGLSKDYSGRCEVDHCNGRSSVLVDAFRDMAKTEAERIARNYKPDKAEMESFKTAFKREFTSQFSYLSRDIARNKAQEIVKEISHSLEVDIDELMGNVNQE